MYKSFGDSEQRVEVLKGIDLLLRGGETVTIVGASGVGKSTLLHLLGALEQPDEGTVLYEGRDVWELEEEQLAGLRNRYVGFVFQFHHLLPEFSAVENVMIPGLIARMEKKAARGLAEDILGSVGLQNRLNHKVGMLSGGEQQRVALARALVLSPRLLLGDEPTGNLDAQTGQRVHELILDLCRRNHMSTVLVTHNLNLARRADRCLTIVDGHLQETDLGSVSM